MMACLSPSLAARKGHHQKKKRLELDTHTCHSLIYLTLLLFCPFALLGFRHSPIAFGSKSGLRWRQDVAVSGASGAFEVDLA